MPDALRSKQARAWARFVITSVIALAAASPIVIGGGKLPIAAASINSGLTPQSATFGPGFARTWTAPAGTYSVTIIATGGSGANCYSHLGAAGGVGGLGGTVVEAIPVTPGQVLDVAAGYAASGYYGGGTGEASGGGGWAGPGDEPDGVGGNGGGGGGASWVSYAGTGP